MDITYDQLEFFLHDNAHLVRRWIYNPLVMAANSTTKLFKVLSWCDDESIKKCLMDMGLKPITFPDGEKRLDYFTMLERNIEFVKILRNRRYNFGSYHEYDKLYTWVNNEEKLEKLNEFIRINEAFEKEI